MRKWGLQGGGEGTQLEGEGEKESEKEAKTLCKVMCMCEVLCKDSEENRAAAGKASRSGEGQREGGRHWTGMELEG